MNNLAINRELPNNLLTIDESAYFDVEKKQLKYQSEVYNDAETMEEAYTDVNRYALVRKDTGQLLGIHSNDYIIRPYSELAEKVNDVIVEAVPDYERFTIKTEDRVYEGGKKYMRTINFWDDKIDMSNFKDNGMHIEGKQEAIIPQLRIYSSMDGRWGQQIMWSSMYVVCLNGMVRPDWSFVVYNKHNSRKDISFSLYDFRMGITAHQELGDDLFKMMQRKVTNNAVTHLFRKTLANKQTKLDIDDNSLLVLKHLDSLWDNYCNKYGSTIFAVYQTATDWATHPITKGAIHNVSRKREKQVAEMMQTNYWQELYG
ncbi:phage/plasmid-like protein TIGR03299 (TIGR03299) [uncultured Mediterranean phage uvMED]|nr:phage/plasmid-like protein TIGR03299 (TIGR03299) [uncultured Mediterranean phage uvMED]